MARIPPSVRALLSRRGRHPALPDPPAPVIYAETASTHGRIPPSDAANVLSPPTAPKKSPTPRPTGRRAKLRRYAPDGGRIVTDTSPASPIPKPVTGTSSITRAPGGVASGPDAAEVFTALNSRGLLGRGWVPTTTTGCGRCWPASGTRTSVRPGTHQFGVVRSLRERSPRSGERLRFAELSVLCARVVATRSRSERTTPKTPPGSGCPFVSGMRSRSGSARPRTRRRRRHMPTRSRRRTRPAGSPSYCPTAAMTPEVVPETLTRRANRGRKQFRRYSGHP